MRDCEIYVQDPSEAEDESTPSGQVEHILENLPSWCFEEDPEVREYILKRMYRISRFSTSQIRAGIVKFMEHRAHREMGNKTIDEKMELMAEIYLLNRVVFEVPEYVTKEECAKMGPSSHPVVAEGPRKGMHRVLFPLARGKDGKLSIEASLPDLPLVSTFYYGSVLQEFDYLKENYPRTALKLRNGSVFMLKTPP